MKFNGVVNDLMEGKGNGIEYVLTYRGVYPEKLRKYVEEVVKGKGLVEVGPMGMEKDGDGWKCSVRVRSERGIV